MFNNLININDFTELWRRIKSNPRLLSQIKNKLFSSHQNKVELTWSHTNAVPDKWWFISEFTRRRNLLITSDPLKNYEQYFAEKYLVDGNNYKALSLACGTGSRELQWIKTNKFSSIDAYDLSESRISHARNEAVKQKCDDKLLFNVGNAGSVRLKENYYDLFLGEQSLHHFSPLENILLRIKKSLNSGGLILVNEYAGPDRFQWTEEQVYYANKLLDILPEQYRTYWNSKVIKRKIYIPGKLRMLINDPSEAVESSKILFLLKKHFEQIELTNYGGTLLHLVFDGIAHNFFCEDAETKNILQRCIDFEDELLNSGKLKSDFVFAVFRNVE